MITKEHKAKIIEGIAIEDVVSRYVPDLKRKGRHMWACCPFHNEKTPSFCVTPDTGRWHCFGQCQEGGNVIDFMMKIENLTYPLACQKLLKDYLHIELKDADLYLTPEEEALEKKRETMLIYNDLVCKWFVEQLHKNTPSAKAAKDYIAFRWEDEDFCKEMSIGYAPDSWDELVDWAKGKSFDLDIFQEMGLIKISNNTHKLFSFFRNRVMIPIRDIYGRVIGFSGRALDDNGPKYMNSCNSLIYNKEKSIFGIDRAMRQARKEEKVYLVEGAPDAMRMQMIGINNTVATLGGSWTKSQFEQLKRLNVSLCFIPDSDTPKEGETLGVGTKYVIKNGIEAIRMGFSVSVREIPNDTGKKMDPDSYIKSENIFNGMNEEEFILWFARITWNKDFLAEEKVRFIGEVCNLIVYIKDENIQESYINELVKKYHNRPLWTSGMRTARRRQHEEKTRKSSQEEYEMLQTYGFTIKNNCYYSCGKDGAQKKLSNFILKPCIHVLDDVLPLRIFEIINDDPGSKPEIVELDMETFTSSKSLRKKLFGLGNYVWLGDENALLQLQAYLAKTTETAKQIRQMGWQREGFYCFCNGAVEDDEWIPVDEMGIVRLKKGNIYIPAMSKLYKDSKELFVNERKFIHLNYSRISFCDYFAKVIQVFGDNAKVGTCFALGSFFRDIIVNKLGFFPIFNIFGPKGSGKTQLGTSLMGLVIREHKPTSLGTATLAALSEEVAFSSNAPLHLDEYKNDIGFWKIEWLKDMWGGIGRSRMSLDKDKRREQSRVDCALIITGQEIPTADIALFTRLIFVSCDKQHHTKEERALFEELVEIRKLGLTHLTIEILKHRNSFAAIFDEAWKKAGNDLEKMLDGEDIIDRIEHNWQVVLAVYLSLEKCLDMPFSYEDLLDICVKGIKRQNSMCNSTDEIATFWNIISSAQQKGLLKEGQDFMIRTKDKFNVTSSKQPLMFNPPARILMIRKNITFMTYRQLGKQMDVKIIPSESMLFYLQNTPDYIGVSSTAQRFKRYGPNGMPQQDIKTDEKGSIISSKIIWDRDRPICFDYEKICKKFGIIMDSSMMEEIDSQVDNNTPPLEEGSMNFDDEPF